MKKILFVLVAVATLATLATPATAQPPEAPPGTDTPPGLARKTDPAEVRAQNAPEPALRALGRHTYILEQSDTAPTPAASNRSGRAQLSAGGGVGIGLDIAPGQLKRSSQPGIAHAKTGQSEYFVQNLDGDLGMRVMVSLEGPNAPTDYTFDLDLPPGAVVLEAADGTVGIGLDDKLLGTITPPWAIDASGDPVPVTQTVTETEIVLSVDTAAVSAWPVIADPTYSSFSNCLTSTNTANAVAYSTGVACATLWDYFALGYFPSWILHFGKGRVGRQSGGCSYSPDRIDVWGIGTVLDFNQACDVHDYLYDLRRRVGYPNVSKASSDTIFRDLMYWDCQHRTGSLWYPSPQQTCFHYATTAYGLVVAFAD